MLHGLPAVAGFYTFTSATSDAGVTAVAGTIELSGITGVVGVAYVEVSAVIFVLLLLAWCPCLFKTNIFN